MVDLVKMPLNLQNDCDIVSEDVYYEFIRSGNIPRGVKVAVSRTASLRGFQGVPAL
jgi:hypothetical protein